MTVSSAERILAAAFGDVPREEGDVFWDLLVVRGGRIKRASEELTPYSEVGRLGRDDSCCEGYGPVTRQLALRLGHDARCVVLILSLRYMS